MVVLILALIVALLLLAVAGWVLWVLITALVIGAVIGGLARLVLPGKQDIGIVSTVIIGWIGSFVGGLLGRHVFHVGSILTVLCEIGLAAVLVALAGSGAGNAVAHRNATLRW